MTMKRRTVEGTARIDSFDLADGDRKLSVSNTPYILDYDAGSDVNGDYITLLREDYELESIRIESKAAIKGSRQKFFLCPKCKKRVRFLYINSTGFKCRECSGVGYSLQQEWHDCIWYYEKGVQFAREYLSWTPPKDLVPVDFGGEVPERPAGMHKKTYRKLLKKFKWYQDMYHKRYDEELEKILYHCMCEEKRRLGGYVQ